MHFSHMHHDSGSKASKFALVAGLHALIAVGVVNMINNKVISLPSLPTDLTVVLRPEPVEPPPVPIEPPTPMPQVRRRRSWCRGSRSRCRRHRSTTRCMATTTEVPPVQQPAQPMQAELPAKPLTPSTNTGAMRSAVLADASGCVKPNYPAASARNGDSGNGDAGAAGRRRRPRDQFAHPEVERLS